MKAKHEVLIHVQRNGVVHFRVDEHGVTMRGKLRPWTAVEREIYAQAFAAAAAGFGWDVEDGRVTADHHYCFHVAVRDVREGLAGG